MEPDCRVIRAEVRPTEALDALFLVPEHGDGTKLLRAVRAGLGPQGSSCDPFCRGGQGACPDRWTPR